MPVRKTPDGRIVEENTKRIAADTGQGRTILSSGSTPRAAKPKDALDDKTRIMRPGDGLGSTGPDGATAKAGAANTGPDGATQKFGVTQSGTSRPADLSKTQLVRPGGLSEEKAESQDPVVGWLVVEAGPGRGQSCEIGMGMNTVGRGSDQRIALSFGDATISSNKHCMVSYDPRSRLFGLHLGDGANLTYVNGEPVYGSVDLTNYAGIEVGETTLRFIAFCGPEFSWSEQE